MSVETAFDGKTLTVTKTFAHPVSDVFDAWIDAAKTTHWWGCGQTTKVASTIQPMVDGDYHHVMTIDGVGEHAIEGRLLEYNPPHKLAYTMPANDVSPEMLVAVTFEDTGNGTRVTLTQSEISDTLKDIVAAGWSASFERLAGFFEGKRRAA